MGWTCRKKHGEPSPKLPVCSCCTQPPGKNGGEAFTKLTQWSDSQNSVGFKCHNLTHFKQQKQRTSESIYHNFTENTENIKLKTQNIIINIFFFLFFYLVTVQIILPWKPKEKLWTQEMCWQQWRKWNLNGSWSLSEKLWKVSASVHCCKKVKTIIVYIATSRRAADKHQSGLVDSDCLCK